MAWEFIESSRLFTLKKSRSQICRARVGRVARQGLGVWEVPGWCQGDPCCLRTESEGLKGLSPMGRAWYLDKEGVPRICELVRDPAGRDCSKEGLGGWVRPQASGISFSSSHSGGWDRIAGTGHRNLPLFPARGEMP